MFGLQRVYLGIPSHFVASPGVQDTLVVEGMRAIAAVGLLYPFLETASEPHSLCTINQYLFVCLNGMEST
jgi:hypothetical protein